MPLLSCQFPFFIWAFRKCLRINSQLVSNIFLSETLWWKELVVILSQQQKHICIMLNQSVSARYNYVTKISYIHPCLKILPGFSIHRLIVSSEQNIHALSKECAHIELNCHSTEFHTYIKIPNESMRSVWVYFYLFLYWAISHSIQTNYNCL